MIKTLSEEKQEAFLKMTSVAHDFKGYLGAINKKHTSSYWVYYYFPTKIAIDHFLQEITIGKGLGQMAQSKGLVCKVLL
jgi:hypothetical protein